MPKRKKKINKLSVILKLIPYISKRKRASIKELSEIFSMDEKDIKNCLNTACFTGIPPYTPGDLIYCYVDGDTVEIKFSEHLKAPVRLSIAEACAVSWYIDKMQSSGMLDKKQAESIKDKLSKCLQKTEFLPKNFIRTVDTHSGMPEISRKVAEALNGQKVIDLRYYSSMSDKIVLRTVIPEELFFRAGIGYIWAYDVEDTRRKLFRLERIIKCSISKKKASAGYKCLKKELDKTFSDFPDKGNIVKIHFSPHTSEYLSFSMPSSSAEKQKDGSIILSLNVISMKWLVKWLIPFGTDAEILEPQSARKVMREYLDRVLESYKRVGRTSKKSYKPKVSEMGNLDGEVLNMNWLHWKKDKKAEDEKE